MKKSPLTLTPSFTPTRSAAALALMLVLTLSPAMARAAVPAPAPSPTLDPSLPQACTVLLDGDRPRTRCVLSRDKSMEKAPGEKGAPVIWDRLITDPTTLRTLTTHTA